jgi:hypothetical protein
VCKAFLRVCFFQWPMRRAIFSILLGEIRIIESTFVGTWHFVRTGLAHIATAGAAMGGGVHSDNPGIRFRKTFSIPTAQYLTGASLDPLILGTANSTGMCVHDFDYSRSEKRNAGSCLPL